MAKYKIFVNKIHNILVQGHLKKKNLRKSMIFGNPGSGGPWKKIQDVVWKTFLKKWKNGKILKIVCKGIVGRSRSCLYRQCNFWLRSSIIIKSIIFWSHNTWIKFLENLHYLVKISWVRRSIEKSRILVRSLKKNY